MRGDAGRLAVPGDYNDYARNPGEYWKQWARDIEAGKSKYLRP